MSSDQGNIKLSASRLLSRRPLLSPAESAANLGVPDGAIGEQAAEYLEEFVGTHHHQHNRSDSNGGRERSRSTGFNVDQEEEDEVARRKALPWYRRPSPWWLLCAVPFAAIAKTSALAPRVELYTMLACRVHKPDIFNESYTIKWPNIVLTKTLVEQQKQQEQSHSPRSIFDLAAETSPVPALPLFGSEGSWTPGFVHFNEEPALERRRPKGKPSSPCAADPTVQAAVARLSAVTETTMGVLSLLTTGWWGAFADRHGRATILAISVVGLLVVDLSLIVIYYYADILPGNYWFIMFGAVLEGLLGGFSTAVAAQHAYIAETSTDATRARYLSLNLGLLFTGMAFGPTIGSLLIRSTGVIISVFWLTLTVHLVYAILIFFGLPEPLSKRRMMQSRKKYAEELRVDAEEMASGSGPGWKVRVKRLFRFLSPLSILMPNFVDNDRKPLKTKERDWTLALLAVAYGFTISIIALTPYLFQFATSSFGWSSETLGYWLSLVGAGRAVWLTIVLPVSIKLFKAKPIVIEIPASSRARSGPSEEESPLLAPSDSSTSLNPPEAQPTIKKEIHSPRFELGVARLSLGVDILAYALMVFFSSQKVFAIFGAFSAMGIGFSPAMQTLAMAMYSRRGGTETGRLFGALSVVQALSGQILGPAMYGFVYIKTVSVFPRGIFVAGLVCIIISTILMSFVSLPADEELRKELAGVYGRSDEEEPLSAPVEEQSALAPLVEEDGGQRARTTS